MGNNAEPKSAVRQAKVRSRTATEIIGDMQTTVTEFFTRAKEGAITGRPAASLRTRFDTLTQEMAASATAITRQLDRRTKQLANAMEGGNVPAASAASRRSVATKASSRATGGTKARGASGRASSAPNASKAATPSRGASGRATKASSPARSPRRRQQQEPTSAAAHSEAAGGQATE